MKRGKQVGFLLLRELLHAMLLRNFINALSYNFHHVLNKYFGIPIYLVFGSTVLKITLSLRGLGQDLLKNQGSNLQLYISFKSRFHRDTF